MHRAMALSGLSYPNPRTRELLGHGLPYGEHMNDSYQEHVLYNTTLLPFFTTLFWNTMVKGKYGYQALRIPHLIKRTLQNSERDPRAQICQIKYVEPTIRQAFQQDVNLLEARRLTWIKLRPWYDSLHEEWEHSVYSCPGFLRDLANLKAAYRSRDEEMVQEIVRRNVQDLAMPLLDVDPVEFYTTAVYYLYYATLPVRWQSQPQSRPMFAQQTRWRASRAVLATPDHDRAPYATAPPAPQLPWAPFQDPYIADGGLGRMQTTVTLLARHFSFDPSRGIGCDRRQFLDRLAFVYGLQERRFASTLSPALSRAFWTQHALLLRDATRLNSPTMGQEWLPSLAFELPPWPIGARPPVVGSGGVGGPSPPASPGGGSGGGDSRNGGFSGRRGDNGGRRGNGQGRESWWLGGVRGNGGRGGSSNRVAGGWRGSRSLGNDIGRGGANDSVRGSRRGRGGGNDQMRSRSWRGPDKRGDDGSSGRSYRAARASMATPPRASSSLVRAIESNKAQETYELPLPSLSIGEIGDHGSEDDFWVLGDNGSFGYDVYDATGEYCKSVTDENISRLTCSRCDTEAKSGRPVLLRH